MEPMGSVSTMQPGVSLVARKSLENDVLTGSNNETIYWLFGLFLILDKITVSHSCTCISRSFSGTQQNSVSVHLE